MKPRSQVELRPLKTFFRLSEGPNGDLHAAPMPGFFAVLGPGVVAKKMVRETGGGQASAPQAEKNSGKAVGGRAVSLFLPDCDSL